jgi:hypothetical protein
MKKYPWYAWMILGLATAFVGTVWVLVWVL